MTQYMEKMAVGDSIDVKGPLGHFIYKGRGLYSHSGQEGQVKQLSMIAGGTGITPMWQVVQVRLLCPLQLFSPSAHVLHELCLRSPRIDPPSPPKVPLLLQLG